MDQCAVHIDIHFLYWDLIKLYDLIDESGDEDLKDYLPYLQKQLNKVEK